jgi:hypothetical protein
LNKHDTSLRPDRVVAEGEHECGLTSHATKVSSSIRRMAHFAYAEIGHDTRAADVRAFLFLIKNLFWNGFLDTKEKPSGNWMLQHLWWKGFYRFSSALIPILERLFIRDLIRLGEREGRKVEAVRESVQVRLDKKNHAR